MGFEFEVDLINGGRKVAADDGDGHASGFETGDGGKCFGADGAFETVYGDWLGPRVTQNAVMPALKIGCTIGCCSTQAIEAATPNNLFALKSTSTQTHSSDCFYIANVSRAGEMVAICSRNTMLAIRHKTPDD